MELDFAAGPDGRRGTTAAGRAVVAAALRTVDPDGATAAEREKDWRTGYLAHFRRLVDAGLGSPGDWLAIARAGLAGSDARLRLVGPDGTEEPATAALSAAAGRELKTEEVRGRGGSEGFALPYRGELLRGDDVRRRVDAWIAAGVAEPSLAGPIDAVLRNPDWLRLDGWTVTALGAGAEMGPVGPLLGWGATVAAVDIPVPAVWDHLLATARAGAGRLVFPTGDPLPDPAPGPRSSGPRSSGPPGAGPRGSGPRGSGSGDGLSAAPGADLLSEIPAVAAWAAALPGRLALGCYAYADGGRHVRVSAAADLLARRVRADRPDTALAYLATPTDVFAVPAEAVAGATAAWDDRSALRRLGAAATRGRLLRRAYPPEADPGIADSLVPQQGANYALAKRIQRWRAAVDRADGGTVSFHVAPATRTRSVTRHRALKAAYAGAHHYGVEVFEPATSTTLMAALLVHDLHVAPPRHEHPWRDEAHTAVHGGFWRIPYAPRGVLELAAVRGFLSRGH